jgi:hypothetical protein
MRDDSKKWMELLSEEDLGFVKRFVLASGSLKEMASLYGVSYPTVRLRLDRLIGKIELADSQDVPDGFERLLREQHIEGRLDMPTVKRLLDAHRQELEKNHESSDNNPGV